MAEQAINPETKIFFHQEEHKLIGTWLHGIIIEVTNINTKHSIYSILFGNQEHYDQIKERTHKYIHHSYDNDKRLEMSFGGWIEFLINFNVDDYQRVLTLKPGESKWYVIGKWYDFVYGEIQDIGYNTISKEYTLE